MGSTMLPEKDFCICWNVYKIIFGSRKVQERGIFKVGPLTPSAHV